MKKNVTCSYSGNPTSSTLLCELWCDVQKFSGVLCVTCPYKDDLEAVKACELWEELVVLQNTHIPGTGNLTLDDTSSGEPSSGDPSSGDPSLEDQGSEGTSFGETTSKKNVTCFHKKNPSSADLLCELWCGVQEYSGVTCVSCPYISDPEAVQACELWEELLMLQNTNLSESEGQNSEDPSLGEQSPEDPTSGSSSSGDPTTAIVSPGDPSSTNSTKKNVTCSHINNPTSSELLCELWCGVQEYSGLNCVICPYIKDPEAVKACELWEELLMLQNSEITISGDPDLDSPNSVDTSSDDQGLGIIGSDDSSSGENTPKKNVTCSYSKNPTSSAILCELWCGVQEFSGNTCITCPYTDDPEAVKACDIWEDLVMLENLEEPESTTSGDQSTGDPNLEDFISGVSTVKKNVTCSHSDNPTSASLLCDLWCGVQLFNGTNCVTCPYTSDPEAEKACDLWEEFLMLHNLKESENTTTGDPSSGDPSSGDPSSGDPSSGDPSSGDPSSEDPSSGDPSSGDPSSGDPSSEDPGSGDPSSGDPSSGDSNSGDSNSEDIAIKKNVTCSYSDNPTSAALLCDLWCGIQELNGINCVTCPYNDIPEAVKACELWEELVMKESMEETSPASTGTEDQNTVDPNTGNTTTATAQLVSCPYTDSPESGPLLCKLFCEVQAHIGSQCCPDQYVGDPEEQELCALWQELQELGGQVTSTPAPLKPIQCLHMDNPTSSEALCELWCAVQEHSGDMCLVCPEEYVEDPASEQLCSLWSEAEMLEHSQESGVSPAPPPGSDVTCPYRFVSVQT